jgi:hypothetical protein
MDIKVKGTSKVGILAYDLDDMYAIADMKKAQKVSNVSIALSEFMSKMRSIRKYDSIPDVRGELEHLREKEDIKAEISVSEEYYHALFVQCLEDADALEFLD